MPHKIVVVSAVVDTFRMTLYTQTGATHVINQGDPNLEKILAIITPKLSVNEPVELDLTALNAEKPINEYSEMEKKTNGFVRFFKVAKEKISSIFGSEEKQKTPEVKHVASQTLGKASEDIKPTIAATPTVVDAKTEAVAKNQAAVAEVLKNATPVKDDPEPVKATETLVAVVKDSKGNDQVIAGVEALSNQLKHSIRGSEIGIQNFLKRLAEVISQRRHSVDDLMKFMERGDLPVSDAGDIIIYKILNKCKTKLEGIEFDYVDVHSSRVVQRVGTYIHMDHSLVDHDRRNECSNGLHVARRQYLGGFSGNVIVLARVRPEDVIAVPQYDANKMRVCGYHILFEMLEEDRRALISNKPLVTEDGKAKLGKALAGDHVGILEHVKIGGAKGTNLTVTKKVKGERVADELQSNVVQAGDRVESAMQVDDDDKLQAPAVDPKTIAQVADAAKVAVAAEAPLSRAEQAQKLWNTVNSTATMGVRATALETLIELKKKAKVSWNSLGLKDHEINEQSSKLLKQNKVAEAKVAPATAVKEAKEGKVASTQASGTPRERIAALLAMPGAIDRLRAKQIYGIKQDAKKGWSALGVTDSSIIKTIEKKAKD
ncbi:putative rIIB lysis inhibitor [Burkholderia phage vB_BpP_HN04]